MSDCHVEATKDSGIMEDASASLKVREFSSRTFTATPISLNLTQCEHKSNAPSIYNIPSVHDVVSFPSTSNAAIRPANNAFDEADNERSCWICLATEQENPLAAWVQPCKCRGTAKWVHERYLYRWVDEIQKGNALRTVRCQQCRTKYTIVIPQIGKVTYILHAFEIIERSSSPFLAAGIFVGSLYWSAVTFGAITFLQVIGHKKFKKVKFP